MAAGAARVLQGLLQQQQQQQQPAASGQRQHTRSVDCLRGGGWRTGKVVLLPLALIVLTITL